ncbi:MULTISPECIES: RNA 2',3'-cyclic phosphodiesterase [Prauserella salsuginis group]|uniref:RNA 2',3'-cyclic phosphodiesterase n=2 Tax=Prauserella salsuginis group TaxID=2893672 RepID=A0A839XYJ6_9PSEU|nr:MULTISPECIES: RNA 2',3'-cyclic phosphodiesterase [Prauserella salsuginis group]MBB3665086.1 2'-5' RNA ligase [Prauserella sediminis]
MRLFSALPVPEAAADALRARLAECAATDAEGLRWTAPEGWHITLGFYGEDEPEARTAWLARRLDGLQAPVLRLAGAGVFPGVLWAGVIVESGQLAPLADAVRPTGERRRFRAHVTVARGGPRAGLEELASDLAGHRGPAWEPAEVLLLRSDRGPAGPVYTPVSRFGLGRALR